LLYIYIVFINKWKVQGGEDMDEKYKQECSKKNIKASGVLEGTLTIWCSDLTPTKAILIAALKGAGKIRPEQGAKNFTVFAGDIQSLQTIMGVF
jgi:hypothetical protein